MAARNNASFKALPFDPFAEPDPAPADGPAQAEHAAAPLPAGGEPTLSPEDPGRESPAGDAWTLFDDPTAAADSPVTTQVASAPPGPPSQADDTEGLAELLGLAPDFQVDGPQASEPPALGDQAATAGEPQLGAADDPSLEHLIAGIDEDIRRAFGATDESAPQAAELDVPAAEQHVIFTLAGTDYTAPIRNVTEIGHPPATTPVPNVPGWVCGVSNLRGDILSVVDLREFLGLTAAAPGAAARMLVSRTTDDDLLLGLIVDGVKGIRYLPLDRIGAPVTTIDSRVAGYVRGTFQQGDDLYLVLDLESLLHSYELRQFEAA